MLITKPAMSAATLRLVIHKSGDWVGGDTDFMNVILSVKPRFAEAIIEGKKRYEFRKSMFERENVGQVYIYSTSPVSKIVGSFEVEDIIEDSPEGIWETCHRHAAISEDEFFRYFNGAATAFAIKIAHMQGFAIPLDPCSLFEDFRPPQSFCYLAFDIDRVGGNGKRGRAAHWGEGSNGKNTRKVNR